MLIRSTITASLVVVSLAAAGATEGARTAHVSGFVLVALNPQPEPPGAPAPKFHDYVMTNGTVLAGSAEKVALNPQPEPPGVAAFDARRLLPPGPCRTILVTVGAEAARTALTAHAVDTAENGKCAYTIPTPGAKVGSRASIKFSRER